MRHMTATPRAGTASGPSATTKGTRRLLACGAVAGPLFVAVALLQILTRDGFDLRRHPLSLLSLGELGWVQISNFVVSGLLVVTFAIGLRRVLSPGRGGTWGPVLVGGFGVGLVTAGMFVADPSVGFPPGAPEGALDHYSWHSIVHGIGAAVALNGLLLACLVLARRFAAAGQRGWAAYSAATGAAILAIIWWPGQDGISLRLAVATLLAFAWVTATALQLLTGMPRRAESSSTGSEEVTA